MVSMVQPSSHLDSDVAPSPFTSPLDSSPVSIHSKGDARTDDGLGAGDAALTEGYFTDTIPHSGGSIDRVINGGEGAANGDSDGAKTFSVVEAVCLAVCCINSWVVLLVALGIGLTSGGASTCKSFMTGCSARWASSACRAYS